MRTWRCLPISATSCANGDWNVSMQTDASLNVSANRRHCGREGLVTPSSSLSGTPPPPAL